MNFDDIYINILFNLHQTSNLTTVDLSKKLFDKKTYNDLQKQDSMLRHRLKMLVKENIVLCSPTKPKTYNINPENVFLGTGSLHIKVNGGKDIEVDFGDFLVITDSKKYLSINRISGENKDIKIVA
jgi:hypothetical protein